MLLIFRVSFFSVSYCERNVKMYYDCFIFFSVLSNVWKASGTQLLCVRVCSFPPYIHISTQFWDANWVSLILLNSDTVYLEIAPDSTG